MRKSHLICILMTAVAVSSCMTPKDVIYLQDMRQNSQIELENKYEAVISQNDELRIIVSCHDEELAKPFNIFSNNTYFYGNEGNSRMGYLVDIHGNIQMPILGEIHAAGKTRLQLQDEICRMLKDGQYIDDPYVMVRFNNYKIFILGPDGGHAITIPEERCTFLEALALAGDLSDYTRRDKIAVLREVDGKMTMRYLDPRSSRVFNDPYYMLQQNDVIITQSIKSRYHRDDLNFIMSWVSMLSTFVSIATLVIVAKK